jgi:hypothetical protein
MTRRTLIRNLVIPFLAILYLASMSLCAISCSGHAEDCTDEICASGDHPEKEAGDGHSSPEKDAQRCGCSCICQAPAYLPAAHPAAVTIITSNYRIPDVHAPAAAELPPPDHIPLL